MQKKFGSAFVGKMASLSVHIVKEKQSNIIVKATDTNVTIVIGNIQVA